MNHTHHTTIDKKNKYITEQERYKIEALKKAGLSNVKIAELIGKADRTIRREIARGTIRLLNSDLTEREEYCADVAQRKYLENASNKGPAIKIGNDHKLAEYIEDQIINEKYSPDAVIGRIKVKGLKFKKSICTKTLYNYIDKGIFLKLSNKHLLVKKNGVKRKYRKTGKVALNNSKGRSIENRDERIDARETIGHWEMDCVVSGHGSKRVLLVLTERRSRHALITKMCGKTQEEVGKALDRLERKYGHSFKKKFMSITMDNGCEFINQDLIERSVITKKKRTTAYYAHPYSSWERGSNENTNKIIRRFIPKGANISNYTQKEIKRIEQWINNYPRRILGYKTAQEVYQAG
ncbi:MAG: IS30 family transposase [Tissierellales bacterium]|nr:IS30 family transposase [Tissierellales bacterium]